MIASVLFKANPTEFMLALMAFDVVAPVLLLNWGVAGWTFSK
jgi:hypothetical protein